MRDQDDTKRTRFDRMKDTPAKSPAIEAVGGVVIIDGRFFAVKQVKADEFYLGIFIDLIAEFAIQGRGTA